VKTPSTAGFGLNNGGAVVTNCRHGTLILIVDLLSANNPENLTTVQENKPFSVRFYVCFFAILMQKTCLLLDFNT
jgi:hypothetical protein